MICNRHFREYHLSVSTFHLQYNLIQTPCANAVAIPNLYICYALNQKAHFSSKTSKKGCFLLHKIYTSSIYIIQVLQSTLGFSDGSGVTRVQNEVPFFWYRTFLAMEVRIHQKHHCTISTFGKCTRHYAQSSYQWQNWPLKCILILNFSHWSLFKIPAGDPLSNSLS